MAVQDYKINYKSDFVLTINGDAGWALPFCIKFWTGMPSQAYFVGFDGVKYVNCRVGDTPTQLLVMFDDHHLPIGPLRMQIAYHTTIEEFPGSVFDEVTNARDVIVTIDGTDYHVMLDFTGETAPEIEFSLPAYANEAERIQNELQRQQNEADRIAAELQREQATAAAVEGAENVNAQLNGTTLTVTNRQGVSTSVNTKGEQGEQGPVGPEGPQGETGISIVSFLPKSETATTLIYTITFSNGHTQDVAIPKGAKGDTGATGPTGPQGPQGQTGVSITGFVETGETETATLYTITFSNSTTQQVAIPKGEKGERGLPGESGVTGDVSAFTVRQTIDPSATYGPTDIAGAATVQAINQELTELAGQLKYQVTSDITGLAVRQSFGTQTSVFYNNSGNLTAAGYASAYKITLPEGTTKIRIENAYNSVNWARLVYFNDDTKVRTFKQADLPNDPIVLDIPDDVNAIGINRSTKQPMFTVERVEDYIGLDGTLLKPSSVTLPKLADDVRSVLMTNDSEKNKMLLSINDKEYPLRETILQFEVSAYHTDFPSRVMVLGREKYENPIEIIGMRIYEVAAKTVNIFIYDTVLLEKTVEKTVELVAGENIVYFDHPHILQLTEVAGMEGQIAGSFDNNQRQIGCYYLDLQTGVMTAQKKNLFGFTVIYRSGGESESNSVLYAKDFTKESNNGDFVEITNGTIVEGNSGITLSTNSYIYLNREYASNRTIRIIATLYTSSVLKLGYRNAKTGNVAYIATINCANGEISIGNTTTEFNVIDGGKYVIDLIKDDYIAILRITDYDSSAAIEVSSGEYTQNDFPAICLTSGTSPIIEAYAIYSETSEPYIMFFGDSITDGAQTPRYNGRFLARFSDIIGRKIGKPYLTSGRGGSSISYITDEIVGRLFTEAKILRPKYAFVTIGTNGGNTTQNLSTLVRKLSDYGITTILNNVPTRKYNGEEVDITGTNNLLQEIRNTFALEGVKCELACSVNNDGVTTNTDLFGSAEAGYIIHPNGEGHYQIYLRTFIDCPDIYTNAGIYPVPDIVHSGTTAERPANAKLGTIYYDTTLDCHVWSTGEGTWMNKNGSYV